MLALLCTLTYSLGVQRVRPWGDKGGFLARLDAVEGEHGLW